MFQITSQQPSQFSIYRCYGILCKIFFQIRRQDGQKKMLYVSYIIFYRTPTTSCDGKSWEKENTKKKDEKKIV